MPPRVMDYYCAERPFIQNGLPFDALSGCRVGIDAEYYLSRLMAPKKEVHLDAIGGFPLTVKPYIESDLSTFEAYDITPVFVFKGLNIVPRQKSFADYESAITKRRRTWDIYYNSYHNAHTGVERKIMTESFKEVHSTLSSRRFLPELVDFLYAHNVDYLVAPYSSSAQLVYMLNCEDSFIDAIYGPPECFLFGADKILFSADMGPKVFRWISLSSLLADLNFTEEQFKHAFIAVGSELNKNSTFPFFDQQLNVPGGSFVSPLKIAQEVISSGGTIIGAFTVLPDSGKVIEKFQGLLAAVEFMPVLAKNGAITLLAEALKTPEKDGKSAKSTGTPGNGKPESQDDDLKIPNDLYEVLGQRLPHELYFYLSIGVIRPNNLEAVISGEIIDHAPLDGGRSVEYQKYIVSPVVLERKGQLISLLTQFMARYYQFKSYRNKVWYEENRSRDLTTRFTPPLYTQIRSWIVRNSSNESGVRNLAYLLSILSQEESASKTISPKPEKGSEVKKLENNEEILLSVLGRYLQLAGYADGTTHLLTKWGQVLAEGMKADSNGEFQQELVGFIGLLSKKALDFAKPFLPSIAGAVKSGKSEEIKFITLISRLATFLHMDIKPMNYYGPLNQSLLAFRSFIEFEMALNRSLVENSLVSLLANNEAERFKSNEEWTELASMLPFKTTPANCILGTAVQIYLEAVTEKEFSAEAVENAKSTLQEVFNSGPKDIFKDLLRTKHFTTVITKAVTKAADLGLVEASVRDNFVNANIWLAERIN